MVELCGIQNLEKDAVPSDTVGSLNPLCPRHPKSGRFTVENLNNTKTMENEGMSSAEQTSEMWPWREWLEKKWDPRTRSV
jgi:hypothetical protein